MGSAGLDDVKRGAAKIAGRDHQRLAGVGPASPAAPASGTTSASATRAGGNENLTGSPDYGARIIYTGDPGKGCSGDQYVQFNRPLRLRRHTYNSVGLESGRNVLIGCPDKTADLAIARNIRLGGGRQLQLRVDAFNAFNVAVINGRSTTLTLNNPVARVPQNNQFNADGSLNTGRLTPRNAGFGAATGAQNMRNFQAMIRFQF